MPRLRRVTPSRRMTASLASVSVPGSHSKVTSSACVHGVVGHQPLDQALELARGEERRRAAAEVDEVERPASHGGQDRGQLPLARRPRPGSPAPPARSCRCRRGSSRSGSACGRTGCGRRGPAARRHAAARASAGLASRADGLGRPDRKRRIGGHEIAAHLGLLRLNHGQSIGTTDSIYPTLSAGRCNVYCCPVIDSNGGADRSEAKGHGLGGIRGGRGVVVGRVRCAAPSGADPARQPAQGAAVRRRRLLPDRRDSCPWWD